MAQSHAQAYEVLKIRDYRHYLLGRTFFALGVTMLATVVAWQVYEITNDAWSLGLIGLAEFAPFLLVTLLGGYVADRIDRRRIILTCVSLYAVCAVGLWFMSTYFSDFIIATKALPIFGIMGLTGFVRGFLGPAQSAFAAQLVPARLFTNAATMSTVSWHLSSIGGPALGGLLYAYFKSANWVYSIVIFLAILCFILVFSVKYRKKPQKDESIRREGFFESVGAGLTFVFKNQIVLGALALDMFAVLFGGAVALLPAFAKDILNLGAEGLGFMRASPAVGALLMAAILAYYPPKQHSGKILLGAVAGFGMCTLGFAVSKNYYLSMLMLAGTGFFDNVSMVIRGTIVQVFTPDAMRGRVSSVNSLFIGSSNELGAFESGAAARLMGLVPSVIFGGCMTLLVVASAWVTAPKLRNLDLK
jgi:MFS family permease